MDKTGGEYRAHAEIRNAYEILVGNLEGKGHLEDPNI
jgi:hypothetical protein